MNRIVIAAQTLCEKMYDFGHQFLALPIYCSPTCDNFWIKS